MNQKSLIAVLGIVVVILLGTTVYFATINKASQSIVTMPAINPPATQPQSIDTIQRTKDETAPALQTYTNSQYKYQIQYPSGAKVTDQSEKGFGEKGECVVIDYKDGYIAIASTKEGYPCGRTGVGGEVKQLPDEKVNIDGKTYTAKVSNIVEDGTIFSTLDLSNGTHIVFESKSDAKDELKKIVESYKSIK